MGSSCQDQIFIQTKMWGLLLLIFIIHVHFHVESVSNEIWDGIIVTQADFQVLQAFKQELIDTKGFLKSWNDSGYGACSGGWAGIKCAQGQVIVIQLPWKGLGGRITQHIGQLQALRKLSLHDNLIGGQIPQSLGLLPDLRGLQLFNNRLTGSIPPSIGFCPVLQTIDFSNNSITGPIPGSLVNNTKLYRLNLSFNLISGTIPSSLVQSNSLIYLSLQRNNLSGPIPDFTGHGSKLQEVLLHGNSLNGSLPIVFLTGLRNLSRLSLRENRFGGSIPDSIGNISTLTQLDLSYNSFTGEIPSSIGDLPNLASFNVSYNNLSGPVPITLYKKFNFTSFLGNIQLCGYIDSSPCLPPVNPAPPEKPKSRRKKRLSLKNIILIAAGALLVVLISVCCVLLCCLVRKRSSGKRSKEAAVVVTGVEKKKGVASGGGGETSGESGAAGADSGGKLVHFDGPLGFTADDLLCATAEIMGKSTYGTVYRATLEDGNQVAVKRLREKITKGQREFETEVNSIGMIRHPNLLSLRAYYLGPKGEKLLVFDYMQKGSLATFFHARSPDKPIDWATRMNIAKTTAMGLMYLHTQANIIHGNLTSSNVLLDENANAKISDYGISKLMTAAANSNVIATAAALGYRAPELSKLKKANTKSDVYSLGVITLELLTGRSPGEAMEGVDLPRWVASRVKEEWTNEVFDLELMKDAGTIGDELLNCLKLALHCVDPSPAARPEVVQVLQQLQEIRPEVGGGGGGSSAAGPATETATSD